ncbi:EamA family transporter [Clostridium sp. YIM B02569]|uniref:EamA family transporter n=1 Tax=Clostridium sp. YIM B02569 TaxID=2911967 RepID=UPI001EEA0E8D|nr:EamA family transporter [Clostridium sp. YIM B02569]
MNKFIFILLFSVLISSISQIVLKKSANKEYKNFIKEYLNIQVIIGYALLFISTILTILALRGLQYKIVPIIEGAGYIYILILSYLFLKEKITKRKIVGNIIIILGILVFNL